MERVGGPRMQLIFFMHEPFSGQTSRKGCHSLIIVHEITRIEFELDLELPW